MKILCLHGIGSSGSVLDSQLQPLMGAIDPTHELVFVDGLVEAPRGPGVPSYHKGPFFSHLRGYSPSDIVEAVEHLRSVLEESGPFDGVLGFSQGASLLISYIYHHQRAGLPLGFNFAIILSATVAWATDTSYCRNIIRSLCGRDRTQRSPSPELDGPAFSAVEREFIDGTLAAVKLARSQGLFLRDGVDSGYDLFDDDESTVPRPLLPPVLTERIRIPTVHMRGKRDADFMRMSKNGLGLCDASMARSLEHSGGHHPPMKPHEVNALAQAMAWAISQSETAALVQAVQQVAV